MYPAFIPHPTSCRVSEIKREQINRPFAGLGWDDGINLLQRQIKIIQKNKPRDDFGKR